MLMRIPKKIQKVIEQSIKEHKEAGVMPQEISFEADILPSLKIIRTQAFVVVMTDYSRCAERHPEVEKQGMFGNVGVEVFDKKHKFLRAFMLYSPYNRERNQKIDKPDFSKTGGRYEPPLVL